MKGVFRFRRQQFNFAPVGDEAKGALAAVKDGKEFMAEIHAPRNARQFRLWWALMGILADNDGTTKEAAKDSILYALKQVDPFYDLKTGVLRFKPKSVAYESMTQVAFAQLFEPSVALICERLGTAPEEIRARVEELVSPARGDGTGRG